MYIKHTLYISNVNDTDIFNPFVSVYVRNYILLIKAS